MDLNNPLVLKTWNSIMEAAHRGQFFKVKFIKRTTKETREMVCRTNVKKHTTGAGASYSFKDKGLLPVWDIQRYNELIKAGETEEKAGKASYRSIPVENILEISLDIPAING